MTPLELAEIHARLRRLQQLQTAHRVALVTLLSTRGPAFRRPGAVMLVSADGTIVRGMSAGCPEADIARQAAEVIENNVARRVIYDREHGYDVLIEMGCGGELEVLIEAFSAEELLPALGAIDTCMRSRRSSLSLLLHSVDGNCLPRPQRMIWSGTNTYSNLDREARFGLVQMLAEREKDRRRAENLSVDTQNGTHEIFLQPFLPPLQLVLVGTGTVCQSLARQGAALGWKTVLVDHQPVTDPGHTGASRWITARPEQLSSELTLDAQTAVLVATHNFQRDIEYLRALRDAPVAYLGALGARIRAQKLLDATGKTRAPLHTPAGLDIGAETPEEIALSIAAEIRAVLNAHAGAPLVASRGPIH